MSEMLRRVTVMMGKVAAGPTSITFVSSSVGAGSVTKPTGIVAGDFIIIFGSGTDPGVWTPVSGFTDLTGGVSSIVGGCYKVAGGSEPSTYAYGNGSSFQGMACAVFRGASAMDVVGAYGSGVGVTNLDLPSVTTTTNADMLIGWCGANGGVSMNAVTGMTRITSATNPPVAIYYQLLTASGATGVRNVPVGGGSTSLVGGLIALKP